MPEDEIGRLDEDELNSDWLGSARLKKSAKKGGKRLKLAVFKKLIEKENAKLRPMTDAEIEEADRRLRSDS